jgi:hypothetical protein
MKFTSFGKISLVSLLLTSLLMSVSAQAATAKAGASCTKIKATQIVGKKKFTCIKSGKKLVWNKGITVAAPKQSPSPSITRTPSPTPLATPAPSVSPAVTISASPTPVNTPSPKPSDTPSPSASPSPSATPTPKVEPTTPPHTGTVDDPQPINTFLNKNGIKVKVNKVTDKVSELVCKTELIHDGCDFGGAVDADSTSRFVEIVITVVNNGTETWIPAIFGLFKDDEYFGGDFIVDGDIPGVIELEVGQSITLNAYSAISQEVKLKDCLFFISESSAEEAFFLKVD